MKKRENATIWESKSNACYEYQCYNDSGPIYWKQCNSTDKTKNVCENDQCVDNKEMIVYVEIDVEGIDLTNLNMTEIQSTISNLTNIETDKLRIRVDINDNDKVVHIIVIVDDKSTADIIKDKISTAIKEGNPKIRQFKRVEVKVKELEVSSGMMYEGWMSLIMVVLISFLVQIH